MESDSTYIFNPDKNAQIRAERSVGFEDVIYCINNDMVLDIVKHHNSEMYPNQYIMIIDIDGYAYQVPFQYEGKNIRLITIFPSRKCTKTYLGGK